MNNEFKDYTLEDLLDRHHDGNGGEREDWEARKEILRRFKELEKSLSKSNIFKFWKSA